MKKILLLIIFISSITTFSHGFAILSHQAVIDAAWEKSIRPLLLKKYPGATKDQLTEAYSYLYGGALMPDIGYSPFGSLTFTNLIHYVRTGDFVSALIDEADNLNEYAFALGMLCHYQADKYGHSLGTNVAVALLFPKLEKKHGDTIPYELGRTEHTRVEFGFDVIQTAKGNYNLEAKRNFVGFKISEAVLNRAFKKTYGLELNDLFTNLNIAIETFRFAVKQLMPELTKDAWHARHSVISKLDPTAKKKSYVSKMDRKKYRKEFGRPGLKTVVFSFIIGIIPKVGPVSGLKYKEPDDKVGKIFDRCFDTIVEKYIGSLKQLESDNLMLENINYDTGYRTRPGDYMHTDETYYALLLKNKKNNFAGVNKSLQKDLLKYFDDVGKLKKYSNKKSKKKKINEAISLLKTSSIQHN